MQKMRKVVADSPEKADAHGTIRVPRVISVAYASRVYSVLSSYASARSSGGIEACVNNGIHAGRVCYLNTRGTRMLRYSPARYLVHPVYWSTFSLVISSTGIRVSS